MKKIEYNNTIMSRIKSLFKLEKIEKRFNIEDSAHVDRFLRSRGYITSAGVDVNPHTALTSTAVFACIRVLSFSLAQLPLVVYRRLERGKERAVNHPAYKLLHDRPNPEMSSFQWRSTSMAHICLYGNAYSEIEFDKFGNPTALYFIPAWRCRPVRVTTSRGRELIYEIDLHSGEKKRMVPQQILHFKGLSTNGTEGLSLIRQAAQSIGVTLAAQEFAAKFFGEGMNISGIAEHPGSLSDIAFDRLKETLTEQYSGLSRSHRVMLLEEGMKFNKVGIPPEEAQFLETRQFQVIDFARVTGVPPHKIADLTRATFSNIEEQNMDFVQDTMMPHFVNWEQEINYKMLGDGYFAEFLVEGLLRADSKSRAEFYNKMFQMASLSPNDIREKENLNPVEHGDTYFIPLNLAPVDHEEPEKIEWVKSPKKPEARKATKTRFKVAQSYRYIFKEAGKRIVEREVKNLRKELKKQLSDKPTITFKEYIEDFYRDFKDYIVKQIAPAVVSLSGAIVPIAEEEVGAANTNVSTFLDEYADTFAYRYTESSKGQIESIIDKDDYEDELEERLSEWEEKRPDKIAMNETVQLSNAVAKVVFASAGIMYLVWRNASGNPCPYCQEMDGRIVGIDQDFVGDTAFAKGEKDMKIRRPATHPPLHNGCECQIEAE